MRFLKGHALRLTTQTPGKFYFEIHLQCWFIDYIFKKQFYSFILYLIFEKREANLISKLDEPFRSAGYTMKHLGLFPKTIMTQKSYNHEMLTHCANSLGENSKRKFQRCFHW